MKGKRKLSVKWKVFAYFAGFTALMLVLLWVFQIGFLEDVYRVTKIHSIKTNAKLIAQNIDSDDLEQQVLDMGQAGEMCIDIYNDRYTTPYCAAIPNPAVCCTTCRSATFQAFTGSQRKTAVPTTSP